MLRMVKNDRLTSDHTAPFTNARSQKAVHEIQFTNASSQKASPQKERKGELSSEGQKRYFMTISAKSCNRDCRITEIKELTSLFETSTRRAESTINVHSSRKRQENRQARQETAKTGPDALRLKAGSRSRPCVVRAPVSCAPLTVFLKEYVPGRAVCLILRPLSVDFRPRLRRSLTSPALRVFRPIPHPRPGPPGGLPRCRRGLAGSFRPRRRRRATECSSGCPRQAGSLPRKPAVPRCCRTYR